MDNEGYFHGRESAQPIIRFDNHRRPGRAIKARYGPSLSLEGPRSHNSNDNDDLRYQRKHGNRPHHRPRKMLLQPALGHLYEVLSDAHDFYRSFSREYEEEVRGIRPYAGTEILDRLWTIRARLGDENENHAPHKAREEGDNHAEHHDYHRNHAMSFRDCVENVQTAFGTVIDAAPSFNRSTNSTNDAESTSRLVKKIDVAYRAMRQLMRTAHRRQAHLTELVTETELLLVYLDRTKDLWECHATRGDRKECPQSHAELAEGGLPPIPQDSEQGEYLVSDVWKPYR